MAAEQVTEQVAEHLEEVAEVTRRIDPRLVKYFLGGLGVGAAIGFFIGYRFNHEKIKAEAFRESEAEIESIRKHYQSKIKARENENEKAELLEIVVEEEYTVDEVEPPRGIQSFEDLSRRPLPPPVPVNPAKRVFRSTSTEKDKMDGWNFPKELAQRSSDQPFIIHQDEFHHNEAEYTQVSYEYYEEDDVLIDEDKSVILNRDQLVVRNFAERFGHGTDDFNILFVRNPVLELDIEICRSPGSYEVEVLGLEREPDDDSLS